MSSFWFFKRRAVGITLFNHRGERPSGHSTFVFHLKWLESKEHFNKDSISLLKRSGLDFARCAFEGIPSDVFLAHFFMLTRNANVCFILFHGIYDLAYMVRLSFGAIVSKQQFLANLAVLFPRFLDLKKLAQTSALRFNGGLDSLAKQMLVGRVGNQHNSGSDSR